MATALTNTGVLFPDATTQTTAAVSVPSFPSGTVMLFVQTSAPTGWTKSTAHDNKALRLVSGTAGSGGSAAFTTAFGTPSVSGSVSLSGTVGATTLSTAQLASHSHGLPFPSVFNGFGSGVRPNSNDGYNNYAATNNAGSNSSHTHGFSGSGSLSSATTAINVAYVDVIIATKD